MPERVVFALRAAATLALFTICSLVMLAVAAATLFRTRRFCSERIATPFGRLALKVWGIRMRVHPHPPLPAVQTVFISNHTSTIDVFVLIALGLTNTRFFLSGFLRKFPPLGLIGYLIGIFWTVDQKYPARRTEIFRRAARILRATGESVYLSPEGERITTGRIGPFNKGAFHLATDLHAPIVPFFIRIPREIDPGKGLHARPGTVDVHFAAPVDTRDWRVEDLLANRDRIHDFYVRWHAELVGA